MPEFDATSFQAAFERNSAVLVLYARTWLDHAAAEDVVQEAFVRLLAQAVAPSDARAWLFRVVRNLAISHRRSAARRRAGVLEGDEPVLLVASPGAAASPPEVCRAVASLDPELREVLVLRVWCGQGLEQIGGLTGTSAATAHRMLARALEQVRQTLEASCQTKHQSTRC